MKIGERHTYAGDRTFTTQTAKLDFRDSESEDDEAGNESEPEDDGSAPIDNELPGSGGGDTQIQQLDTTQQMEFGMGYQSDGQRAGKITLQFDVAGASVPTASSVSGGDSRLSFLHYADEDADATTQVIKDGDDIVQVKSDDALAVVAESGQGVTLTFYKAADVTLNSTTGRYDINTGAVSIATHTIFRTANGELTLTSTSGGDTRVRVLSATAATPTDGVTSYVYGSRKIVETTLVTHPGNATTPVPWSNYPTGDHTLPGGYKFQPANVTAGTVRTVERTEYKLIGNLEKEQATTTEIYRYYQTNDGTPIEGEEKLASRVVTDPSGTVLSCEEFDYFVKGAAPADQTAIENYAYTGDYANGGLRFHSLNGKWAVFKPATSDAVQTTQVNPWLDGPESGPPLVPERKVVYDPSSDVYRLLWDDPFVNRVGMRLTTSSETRFFDEVEGIYLIDQFVSETNENHPKTGATPAVKVTRDSIVSAYTASSTSATANVTKKSYAYFENETSLSDPALGGAPVPADNLKKGRLLYEEDDASATDHDEEVLGPGSAMPGAVKRTTTRYGRKVSQYSGYPFAFTPLRKTESLTLEGKVMQETDFAWVPGSQAGQGVWTQQRQRVYAYNTATGKLATITENGVPLEDRACPASGTPGITTEQVTDAAGIVTQRDMNADGELVAERAYLGLNPSVPVTTTRAYSYDESSGLTTETTTVSGGSGTSAASHTTSRVTRLDGKLMRETDALGRSTSYAYGSTPAGGERVTATLPGGLTRVTDYYLDGQLKSISGTGVHTPEFHTYTANGTSALYGTITETIYLNDDGAGGTRSQRFKKITRNGLGWVLLEEEPGPTGALITQKHLYNRAGQRARTLRSGGLAAICYEYDHTGQVSATGLDLNNGDSDGDGNRLDLNSSDTITSAVRTEGEFSQATTQTYALNNNITSLVTSYTAQRAGLAAGNAVIAKTGHADGTETQVKLLRNRALREETYETIAPNPDESGTRVMRGGWLWKELTRRSGWVFTTPGPLGYPARTTYADGKYIDWTYNAAGQLLARQEMWSGGGTTSYAYYPAADANSDGVTDDANAGRLRSITYPGGARRFYAYDVEGRLTHEWGSAAYPVKYVYDAFGELEEMHTYPGVADAAWETETLPAGFAAAGHVTTWMRDSASGYLTGKQDHAGAAVTYQYKASGLLDKRLWARTLPGSSTKVTTTYGFETFGSITSGRLASKTYNDGTPGVTYTYRRDNQVASVKDASGIRDFVYHVGSGLPDSENISANPAAGSLNLLAGGKTARTWLRKDWPASIAHSLVSGNATQALYTATYQLAGAAYSANSGQGGLGAINGGEIALSQQDAAGFIRHKAAFTSAPFAFEQEREIDYRGRVLRTRAGVAGWGPMLGHSYSYDALGRRSAATITGYGAYPRWAYSYNERGEVAGAARGTSEGMAVDSQSWGYGYDNLGNRLAAIRGPSGPEQAARTTAYRPNALNQYESDPADGDPPAIAHSRRVELSGQLAEGAAVSVKLAGSAAALDGAGTGEPGSWRAEVDASSDWGWFALEAEGSAPALSATLTRRGWHYVPPAAEHLSHDADGNLIEDARWTYKWDAENRLVEQTEKAGIPAAVLPPPKRLRLTFACDAEGRRIAKQVYEHQPGTPNPEPGTWMLVKNRRFLYDGWNMTLELEQPSATAAGLAGSAVLREYVWGPDLSGTMQGAGGVGGLLLIRSHTLSSSLSPLSSSTAYAVCYDGNGNITGWARLAFGGEQALAARYDYDPFGNRVTALEPQGEVCPVGFSTKYRDEETGDLYYGHRINRPGWGRWMSRDPIGEAGGLNLYEMVHNDPMNRFDVLGKLEGKFNQEIRNKRGDWSYLYLFSGLSDKKQYAQDVFIAITFKCAGPGPSYNYNHFVQDYIQNQTSETDTHAVNVQLIWDSIVRRKCECGSLSGVWQGTIYEAKYGGIPAGSRPNYGIANGTTTTSSSTGSSSTGPYPDVPGIPNPDLPIAPASAKESRSVTHTFTGGFNKFGITNWRSPDHPDYQ